MSRRWLSVFGVALALLFYGANLPAHADGNQAELLLLTTDPSLVRAVTKALQPWGIAVITQEGAGLGSSMPAVAAEAREIAERQHVEGIAWISRTQDGVALWTYDTRTDQTISRPLSSDPPYDDLHAAAVALSLKTMLRSTEVAPLNERMGPPPTSSAAVVASSTNAAPVAPPPSPPATKPVPHIVDHDRWFGQIGGGARFGSTSNALAEPRVEVVVGRRFSRLAFAASASFGPGTTADGPNYALRLSETSFAVLGRFALVDSTRFSAGLSLQLDLDVFHISGDVGAQRLPVGDAYVDVGFGVGAFGMVRLPPPFALGVSLSANARTNRQQFFVADAPAVDVRPVSFASVLWFAVDL